MSNTNNRPVHPPIPKWKKVLSGIIFSLILVMIFFIICSQFRKGTVGEYIVLMLSLPGSVAAFMAWWIDYNKPDTHNKWGLPIGIASFMILVVTITRILNAEEMIDANVYTEIEQSFIEQYSNELEKTTYSPVIWESNAQIMEKGQNIINQLIKKDYHYQIAGAEQAYSKKLTKQLNLLAHHFCIQNKEAIQLCKEMNEIIQKNVPQGIALLESTYNINPSAEMIEIIEGDGIHISSGQFEEILIDRMDSGLGGESEIENITKIIRSKESHKIDTIKFTTKR